MGNLKHRWTLFWIRRAGLGRFGRIATWLGSLFVPPYKGRAHLAKISPRGYVSLKVEIQHTDLRLGNNVFIGDRVQFYRTRDGGYVELKDRVALYGDSIIETIANDNVIIGEETYIQPLCQLTAAKASIIIGKRVEIAVNCSFFPFNHAMTDGKKIRELPLVSRGDIVIDDDVWLGAGVIVLDSVHIGEGAVTGAGAVVTRDIPANAIAAGVPAKVVQMRSEAGV